MGEIAMTALLSSGDYASSGFLKRMKNAVLRCVKAIEESRMHQMQREIEFHLRLHNIPPKRAGAASLPRIVKPTAKPKSPVK
jgi:hypothetical protein